MAWVGAQRLADEPVLIGKFSENNCETAAVFDKDPEKLGLRIGGLQVLDMTHTEQVVQNPGIGPAVIASAGEEAQGAADKSVVGGVRAMLNLTPVALVVPAGVAARSVDIASELMMLSYYCGGNSHKNAQSVIIARNETKMEEA